MAMTGGPSGEIRAAINVTPLVDVVLVLLIIFMVVTPMLQRGKDVQLPGAKKTDEEQKSGDPLILSVTSDLRVWVENDAYPDDQALQDRIRDTLAGNPGRTVLLKGDASLTFGAVRKVMDIARQGGAKGVALAVQKVSE
jgi:biopolymer transport protein TolR